MLKVKVLYTFMIMKHSCHLINCGVTMKCGVQWFVTSNSNNLYKYSNLSKLSTKSFGRQHFQNPGSSGSLRRKGLILLKPNVRHYKKSFCHVKKRWYFRPYKKFLLNGFDLTHEPDKIRITGCILVHGLPFIDTSFALWSLQYYIHQCSLRY